MQRSTKTCPFQDIMFLLTGDQDHLLTDRGLLIRLSDAGRILMGTAELHDREVLPHLLKANPHKLTFANMMLYLRCQVEDFAWEKWGSPGALDAEWVHRTEDKKKGKKFEEGLLDWRRRTIESLTEMERPGPQTDLWDNGRRR
jgi:DNA-repair protein complementing XP-A cells